MPRIGGGNQVDDQPVHQAFLLLAAEGNEQHHERREVQQQVGRRDRVTVEDFVVGRRREDADHGDTSPEGYPDVLKTVCTSRRLQAPPGFSIHFGLTNQTNLSSFVRCSTTRSRPSWPPIRPFTPPGAVAASRIRPPGAESPTTRPESSSSSIPPHPSPWGSWPSGSASPRPPSRFSSPGWSGSAWWCGRPIPATVAGCGSG